MTEARWLACTDPGPMLEFLRGKASDRKLRLFAVACCRRVIDFLPDVDRRLVDLSERYANGEIDRADFLDGILGLLGISGRARASDVKGTLTGFLSRRRVINPFGGPAYHAAELRPDQAAEAAALACRYYRRTGPNQPPPGAKAEKAEKRAQAALLRDIFGNPFRPVSFALSWQTPDIVALAHAAYEHRDPARLAVLADALEEAGCSDAELLDHLRGQGPHVRGCWALDLILGKS